MRREKLKAIALFTAVFAFFAGSVFVSTSALKAENPSGVHVTVYRTDLLPSIVGPDIPVFTSAGGQSVDIVNNPNQAFGDGSVREGTYKRIHFVVGNQISFTGPNPDPSGLCSGLSATVNSTFLIDQNKSATDKVDLYFATADDGGSSGWLANGTTETPFLIQDPVEVKADATTIVKLIFKTAGTLICSAADTASLTPPSIKTINYVQKKPPTGAACNGEYWFLHYHISSQPVDQQGNPIPQPTVTQILAHAGVVSGWGTMNINPPDDTGSGTWSITGTKYEDPVHPGMAEHRHHLASLCTTESWCDDGYYDPASLPGGASSFGGTYLITGGKMIFNLGGSYIQGGISNDCSTYVGVDMDIKDNSLVLAVKKPSGLSKTVPADSIFVSVGPGTSTRYDTTASSPFPATGFTFDPGWGIVSTNTITNAQLMEWKSKFDFWPMSGAWASFGPSQWVTYSTFDIGTITVGPSGLMTGGPLDSFAGMGTSGSAIQAGALVTGPTPTYDNYQPQHYVDAGFMLNAAKTVSLSDLKGKWIAGAIEGRISDTDGTWGNGNEQPGFGIAYLEAMFDGSGTVCTTALFKDTLTGTMTYDPTTCRAVTLKHECYACDDAAATCKPVSTPEASCLIPGTSTPGIYIPVFYIGDGSVDTKLALDKTKTTIVLWKPNNVSGTPASCTASSGSPCTDVVLKGIAGVGVKVQ